MGRLDRSTQRPEVIGRPGMHSWNARYGWHQLCGQIGAGHSVEEILSDYPYFEREEIVQALRYASVARRRKQSRAG